MKHFDRRLAAADPLRVDLSAIPEEAGQALVQEILMQTDNPVTKAARRGTLVALVTAAAIAVPGIAVAGVAVYRGMHSGVYGAGGEAVAGQEFYYTDAPEIVGVIKELTGEFPLPAGATYDRLLSRYPTAERTLVQRTGLGQQVQTTAACAWYRHWLAGSAAQRAADQPTIDAIPAWRYWVFPGDSAPGPGVAAPKPLDGRSVDDDQDSGRAVLESIALQTRAGTDSMLEQYLVANCR